LNKAKDLVVLGFIVFMALEMLWPKFGPLMAHGWPIIFCEVTTQSGFDLRSFLVGQLLFSSHQIRAKTEIGRNGL